MEPLFCRWLWHAVTVLCDGTVTCGLDDPFKLRDYGNVKTRSIAEILENDAIKHRRHNLLKGQDCGVCQLQTTVDHHNIIQLSPSRPYPKKLVLESSIRCNIRCNNSVCNIANDATFHVRTEDYLQWDVFIKVIDEIGPHIEELFFFNYGEPFINPKALNMLSYTKRNYPHVKVTSSTNGILLARGNQADRIVEEGLVDWLCFTIGGSNEENYGVYHKSASFAKAIEGMSKVAEARRRLGQVKPVIHWRYLLFSWNDSDEHIKQALNLARDIGVDEFKIFLTGTPLEGRSLRRAPGTRGFEAIREWIDYDAHYRIDTYGESGLWHMEDNATLGQLCWTGRKARVLAMPEDGHINIRLARPDLVSIPATDVDLRTSWGRFPAAVGLGAWADNELTVPSELQDSFQPLLVEINTEQPFTPLRHGIGLDGRELGVMVSLETAFPQPNPFRAQPAQGVGPRLRDGCG